MTNEVQSYEREPGSPAMIAVSAVFESFGRVLVCLDREFRIVHASAGLDAMIGREAREALAGRPVTDLLGDELFAPGAPLRDALERNERREGWRATMTASDGSARVVSCSVAAFHHDQDGVCDPTVAYVVLLRPAEEDLFSGTGSPIGFSGMIARSPQMTRIFQLVQNLQASDATILISGETGTGKEVLARAVHASSSRRAGRFIATNCAALPPELLESELFGHVSGAFTGAVRDRVGCVELASGGTWLLDSIGDLPLQLQGKLLRVLQENAFERAGDRQTRKSDVRVIAATDVDLRRAVAAGTFREDLYAQLRVVPIEIPALRERREDIEPLARFLLSRVAARQGRELRFSPDAVRALLRYGWPENVRELENAIEYAVAVGRGPALQPEDLPTEVFDRGTMGTERLGIAAPQGAAAREADILRAALEKHRWQREATARALGISRTTLWRKMREAGLNDLETFQR